MALTLIGDVHGKYERYYRIIRQTENYPYTVQLGDFCHRGGHPMKYRLRINCHNLHIILGNHDKENQFTEYLSETSPTGFKSVHYVKEIIYCNQKIFLSHYPHRSWPSSHKNSYHLYGHVHSKLNHDDMISKKLTLDVGVDNNINYNKPFGQPWSFTEIQQLFNSRIKLNDQN